MQVTLLKLNTGIGARGGDHGDARAPERRARGRHRAPVATRTASRSARGRPGHAPPAPGDVGYLTARDGDAKRAVQRMEPPERRGPGAARQRRDRARLAGRRPPDDALPTTARARRHDDDDRAGDPASTPVPRRPIPTGDAAAAPPPTRPATAATAAADVAVPVELGGLVDRRIGLLFAVFLVMLLLAGGRASWLGLVKADTLQGGRDHAAGARPRRARAPRHDHRRARQRARGLPVRR